LNVGESSTAASLLADWVSGGECLGGQVFVWASGQVVADFAVGTSYQGRPAAVSDVARLYCAVKPVIACCIARAADLGMIRFDDYVTDYLPEFSSGGKETITIRQLLSHTSRLPNLRIDLYKRPFAGSLRLACRTPIAPRMWNSDARYNDHLAWIVLAGVVEKVYGMEFTEIVEHLIEDFVPGSDLRIINPDQSKYAPCHHKSRGDFTAIPQPESSVLFEFANPAHGGFASARGLGLLYKELVCCASGTGTLMSVPIAREIIAQNSLVEFGTGFGERPCGLGFMVDIRSDGIGGEWSRDSFGHGGYVGLYRVVHGFADVQRNVAAAMQLFSVGAKNNWRFQRLSASIWSDLAITRA
jgi:CubicO group peptidase (beta-lactamase class C family)